MSTSTSALPGGPPEPGVAPPVVAVLVVHRPGPEFAETLASLAAQDYPALQCLVLIAGSSGPSDPVTAGVADTVATELPSAVVRHVGPNPGFPSVANMVIGLVEGESGLFLFVHDDVALATDAVSRMVEELYRTNAGVVSPKIVTWADPTVIETVGDDVDRLGARDPVAEAGERDQEQHDAVRDAFSVSSACVLVRGDLFRAVGGFEPSLQVCGADLDFCWRVHLAGARVVVAPSAVVRHRSATTTRLRGIDPVRLEDADEAERLATALSLTPTSSLPLVVAALLGSAVSRSIVALATGTPRRAWTPWRGLVASLRRIGTIRDRRRRARALRTVEASEVRSLQILGSARIRRWWRLRSGAGPSEERDTDLAGRAVVTTRRWSVATWAVLFALTVLGGRSIILHGSESVGQFVAFAGSVGDHWRSFTSSWWQAGLGDSSFAPTGTGLVAVLGAVSFGSMGLAHTLGIVGLPVLGYAGAWALAGVFGQRRARIVGTIAYAAVPLPYAAMSAGRWGALVTYAALPWFVHHGRHLVGHRGETAAAQPATGAPSVQARRRRWAALALTVAAAVAFEPGVLIVVAVVAVLLALGTAIGDGVAWATRWLGVGAAAVVGALVLNLPWSLNFLDGSFWNQLTGAAVTGGRESGLVSLARFDIGRVPFGGVFLLVYVVVIAAILLVRGDRGPWATRGAILAGGTLFLALLDDKALLPARLPEPAVVLVPVALGISLACGALGASLALDVRHASFGWRQPLGAVASVAFVVSLAPTALATVNGRWNQPSTTVVGLLEQLPPAEQAGDYRVLFLGDPRLLPGSPETVGWSVAWSVVEGATPTIRDAWEPTSSTATQSVERAVRSIVRGSTARTGRLLAPFAIRYVVVPVVDGVVSTRDAPLAGADGLVGLLSDQLDMRRRYSSSEVAVFENVAWAPVRAQLTEAGGEASRSGGSVAVITGDVAGSTPVMTADRNRPIASGDVEAGVVHLAVPYDPGWQLTVDGRTFGARPAFGLTVAFDVDEGGSATLSYDDSPIRTLAVWLQCAAWSALFVVAVVRRRGRLGLEP